MTQNNLLTSVSSICRCYYGRNARFDQDGFPYSFSTVAGLIPGLLIAIVSATFVLFIGPVGGGVMTALFVPLAFEMLTGWRGIALSVACIDRLVSGRNQDLEQNDSQNITTLMQRQILFATFYLFRMAVFGLLAASGNAIWFVYVFGGAYLIRGELLKEEPEPFERSEHHNWFIYIVFSLIAGLLAFHWRALASLPLAIILTILLLIASRRFIDRFFGRPEFWMSDFLGYISENIMLIVGLILFGRHLNG
ncbi:MAG: hypothetical protein E7040_11760 [Lentisphaerae bacterium]|nr:hypothetical protein [Lentisphaerota bacterium]